uniref:Tyrosine-protein phosphatase domain-containing protein n=1 Tax=Mucochytrium quahogii TaxID=96639 RepID=A0A7S2W3Q6_9STRA|mmetsp:Transcript_15664/g.27325  ORF Transcript_15664/g.27325 Transcript_15664/m.27325 type:complete len:437 (+) Transcript_15664:858-2168(+)
MASKLFDGLYLGDAFASMDINFIVGNKITRVVNCAGLELENRWERLGIEYLTFNWENSSSFDILTQGGQKSGENLSLSTETSNSPPVPSALIHKQQDCPCIWLETLCTFIRQALDRGEGVLVHSQDGRNRACSCLLAYLMTVYGWDLGKAISYVQCKRRDLLPNQGFYEQLTVLSVWLESVYIDSFPGTVPDKIVAVKFKTWDIGGDDLKKVSQCVDEELLLHNTFLNTGNNIVHCEEDLVKPETQTYATVLTKGKCKSVKWIDSGDAATHGEPLLRSPFSKNVIPERPPGPSYRALHATGDWLEKREEDLDTKERKVQEEELIKTSRSNELPTINGTKLFNNKQKLDWNHLRQQLLRKGMAESFKPPTTTIRGNNQQELLDRRKEVFKQQVENLRFKRNVAKSKINRKRPKKKTNTVTRTKQGLPINYQLAKIKS